MDLRDFEKSAAKQKFGAINKRLMQQFGVSISEGAKMDELNRLLLVVNESIKDAKYNGKTIGSDSDLSRNVLMREAIISRMGEIPADGITRQEEIYTGIIDALVDFVSQCMAIGDTQEVALDAAMREYQSSPYRFTDETVRADVEYCIAQATGNSTIDMDGNMDNFKLKESFVKDLRALLESEVEEAEIVIATKGFSKSLQEMIEKVGRLQNEDLPPLSDQMRSNYDIEVAHSFHEKTQATLQSVLDALYYAKDEIDRVVQEMATGNMQWSTDMEGDSDEFDAEPDLDSDMDLDMDAGMDMDDEDASIEDELAQIESELDDEPLGRIRKESLQAMRNKMNYLQEQLNKKKARK